MLEYWHMENEAVQEEKKEEYVCRETGLFLTDPTDISFYMCEQNDDILRNLLLGKFTKEGKYSIDKEYLMELVKIKKKIVEKKDNVYVLSSKILEIELNFVLSIEDVADGKRVATLCFLEKDNKLDGSSENLKTIIAKYRDDADIYFTEKAFKVFNVKTQESQDGDDIDEEELSNILRRYKEMLMLKKKRVESLDYISNTYIDQVLAILRRYPSKFSEYVLRKYGEGLLKFQNDFGKPLYYAKLKFMLDRIIAGAILEQKDPIVSQLLLKAKVDFVENYKSIHKTILAEATKAPAAKKPAEKAKAPASSSGGAKKKAKAKSKAKPAKKAAAKKKAAPAQYGPIAPRFESAPKKEEEKPKKEPEPKADIRVAHTLSIIDKLASNLETKNKTNIKEISSSPVKTAEASLGMEM